MERNKYLFEVSSNIFYLKLSSVQSLSRVRLFVTPWITACQASLSITNSQSSLRLTSIESVMPSNHLILCRPSSCPQCFPASETSPVSRLFASGGQSMGASASVLRKNGRSYLYHILDRTKTE